MGRIYSQTLMVFVWLGHSGYNIAKGVELAHHLIEATSKMVGIVQREVDMNAPKSIMSVFNNKEALKGLIALDEGIAKDDDAWEAYYDIFRKQWMRRTWVLQEVVIGNPKRCWAFCGDNDATISLAKLQESVQHMALLAMMLQNVNPDSVANAHRIRVPSLQGQESLGMYCLVQMENIANGSNTSLRDLVMMLDRLRYCGCTGMWHISPSSFR